MTTDSARAPSVTLYDDEEEKPDRDRKEYHFQREKGDAEAAIDGISPQRPDRPGRAGRRTTASSPCQGVNLWSDQDPTAPGV